MPPSLSEFRNTLNVKIFDTIASDLSTSSVSSSIDKWGDKTDTVTSLGTLKAVPYNDFEKRQSYQIFGDLNEGEVDMVFKHDANIDVDYIVENVDNQLFSIKQIENYPYINGVLVKIARLSKYHS